MISHADLLSRLHYDPVTGLFTWLISPASNAPIGSVAGTIGKNNHRTITVATKRYLSSRLAYFYMTGTWSSFQIDHKDKDSQNDKWENLREATNQQNNANIGRQKNNTTGYKGVTWDKKNAKWRAQIGFDGRNLPLGRFDCPVAAHLAYQVAADKYFGEFARTA